MLPDIYRCVMRKLPGWRAFQAIDSLECRPGNDFKLIIASNPCPDGVSKM
jgi:hypothetical protein